MSRSISSGHRSAREPPELLAPVWITSLEGASGAVLPGRWLAVAGGGAGGGGGGGGLGGFGGGARGPAWRPSSMRWTCFSVLWPWPCNFLLLAMRSTRFLRVPRLAKLRA